MKKLSLNDFAKANVAIAKKGMMRVKGGKLIEVFITSHQVSASTGGEVSDVTYSIFIEDGTL